ncbi:methylmalonyl-CoA mutase [bacterium]|nr:methylmalonyl-CoA mutase [bacterium]
MKTRNYNFDTLGGLKNDDCYFPSEKQNEEKPGEFPFTRGIHPVQYRRRLWTMRQFAGFGSPEDTNSRFKFLLERGQTGLSVAFDMPTLMGYDSDHDFAEGEVGKCGVAISSLADMETLFDGIQMEEISTSMTINGPAMIIWAFYVAAAQNQGADISKLNGTTQNDILKEYIAQKEWIFPPKPSMRVFVDGVEYATKHTPKWNTVSISGYHIREAGSTAVQELAFTLGDGFAYVEACLERGMDVDEFAPRLSHFFNAHSDFFEEIAKYRAARRIWAKRMKNKYGAKDERSMKLRFHSQTAGCSLSAQQPENNIARTAIQALSAVLGGTQSLHTNSMDETLALPSEKAVEIALRTQQVIAFETGVANTVDPLAGSYYVEDLTDRMEAEAEKIFEKVEKMGGVIAAIERGWFQQEIANAAVRQNNLLEEKQRIMVGVNDFVKENENIEIPILEIDEKVAEMQREKLRNIRESRDNVAVAETLKKLKTACETDENIMPHLIEAAHRYATMGEIVETMKTVWGEWTEPMI